MTISLITPILNPIDAWNAGSGTTFTFNVIGAGDLVRGNELTIRVNETGERIYQEFQSTYAYEHVVEADTLGLQNGQYYDAYVRTSNVAADPSEDNLSAPSNHVQFYCYGDPTFTINAAPTIDTTSVTPTLTYTAASVAEGFEEERLISYTISLYDTAGIQLATSGVIYTSAGTMEYTFGGLNNKTPYKIRATGITNGRTIVAQEKDIFVDIDVPSTSATFTAANICEGGYITLVSSGLNVIDGKFFSIDSSKTPTYIDGKSVDLTTAGDYVTWTNGLNVPQNYSLELWVENPMVDVTIFRGKNSANQEIRISILHGEQIDGEDTLFAEMVVYQPYVSAVSLTPTYSIYSESHEAAGVDVWFVQIKCVDGLYDIDFKPATEV